MDLLSGLRGPLHVILANLPYVPIHRELPRDVAGYEPHLALFAGAHGTELVERLLRQAADLLIEGSEIAVELDEQEQASPIAALARQLYPGAEVAIRLDGGGYQRVVHVMPRKG
jgi:release factor glutamine methyltransferase